MSKTLDYWDKLDEWLYDNEYDNGDDVRECRQCGNDATIGNLCSECRKQKAIDEDTSDLSYLQEGADHE